MFIVSFIVDYSGIIQKLSKFIWGKFNPNIQYDYWIIPLIGCSLCSTFWVLSIYCLLIDLPPIDSVFYGCVGGYFSQFINIILHKIRDIFSKIIN